MPKPRQISLISGKDGTVVKYVPPPAPPTPKLDHFTACLEGMRRAAKKLRELGFQVINEADYTYTLEYRRVIFDFRLQRPDRVAHITSQPSKTEEMKSITYFLNEAVPGAYCLQMNFSAKVSEAPVYAELPLNLADPAAHVYRTIIAFIAGQAQRCALPEASAQALKSEN